jgi:3-oxoacyl-(acyl-carrier-protein) synthase
MNHHKVRSRARLALAAAAGAAIVAAIVVAATGSDHPARVEPVPHGATTAAQARNLERWLTNYSR